MRNIVIVVGSAAPESNTLALAQACAQGANEAGHQTQLFLLGNEPLHGCRGCGA
nr:NAD(P)H-dependent oxidoreductase [Holdemania massiliensis]